MARVNVFVPDELLDLVRATLPTVNVSGLLQEALRELMRCDHKQVACARCAAPIELAELVDGPLSQFYGEALWALGELVHDGGTAEGAAAVLKHVAQRHGVREADRRPLPRSTRANRQRWKAEQARRDHR